MRLIRVDTFGDPDVLRYVEGALPEPGGGEVRVRLFAAGVNPADTYVRSGSYAFFRPTLPYTPGWDGAGVIDSVGVGTSSVSVGERVFVAALPLGSTGTYAQFVVCSAASVHSLPEALTFEQGAAVGVPYLTAFRALVQRGGATAGETVLVHGASGGVGIPTVQLAAGLGLTVIGTAGSEAGRELVKQQGAAHVLDHTDSDHLAEVVELTNGRGVDVVIEMLANENLERDFAALARHGRIVVVGSRGSLQFTPRLTMISESDIRGTALWNMSNEDMATATLAIRQMLASGHATPIVARSFPLSAAAAAQQFVMTSRARGKVVLDCRVE